MAPTFLIIDDSYIDRLVASMLIKRTFGIENVFDVSSGKLGLEWLTNNKDNSGVIVLLDIMMPQMNGFEFLDRFRQLDEKVKEGVMIVMLSSTLDEEDQRRAKGHQNVKKLLSKPLSPNELMDLVKAKSS